MIELSIIVGSVDGQGWTNTVRFCQQRTNHCIGAGLPGRCQLSVQAQWDFDVLSSSSWHPHQMLLYFIK